jgi:hypothetical protein
LASGAFAHHSELADLSCNSVRVTDHNESCLLYAIAHLPTIADDMVPQVLQKSVRTCFPEVSSRGQPYHFSTAKENCLQNLRCYLFFQLQEAMEKDRMEHASEPSLNLKTYLANAYLHPIFHMFEQEDQKEETTVEVRIDKSQHQQQQQQQHQHHVRSSHTQYEESTETHYYHEERSSSQYQYQYQHEETHMRSEQSPPHFGYHHEIQH